MGLGLGWGQGIAGGYDALAEIIATRKKDELLRQKAQDDDLKQQLDLAKFSEDTRQNRVQEARLQDQTDAISSWRDSQVADQQRKAQESVDKQKRLQAALDAYQKNPSQENLVALSVAGATIPAGAYGQTPEEKLHQAEVIANIKAATAAAAAANKQPKTRIVNTVDKDGNPIQLIVPDELGASYPLAPTTAERSQAHELPAVEAVIQGLDSLSKNINTQEGLPQLASGMKRHAAAMANQDDEAANYLSLKEAWTLTLARLQAQQRISNQEMTNANKLAPNLSDPKGVRDAKIARMWQFYREKVKSLPPGTRAVAPGADAGAGSKTTPGGYEDLGSDSGGGSFDFSGAGGVQPQSNAAPKSAFEFLGVGQ